MAKWPVLLALLGVGCTDVSEFSTPITRPIATWATLVSPAVRAALRVRAELTAEPPTPVVVPEAVVEPAALVGVYRAGDALLVLDASGGWTLSPPGAAGRWEVAGEALLLSGEEGPVRRLSLAPDEALRETAGAIFAPIVATPTPITGDVP